MSELSVDERAAIRSFLQRSEVRLSTLHRVATALLSGAGLMVLLPAIARDSIVEVMRTLIETETSVSHVLLAAAIVTMLVLPFVALWMLLRDLTRFYFHAHHVQAGASEIFTPRFTLTGLWLPADELGPVAHGELDEARRDPTTVGLLVPPKESTRRRIDRQLDAYGGLGRRELGGDEGRAAGLFQLVAARQRDLLEEVAKVEHGIARHILRLQTIVLRYVKALLAFLTTAPAVFAASAVVSSDRLIGPSAEIALGGIVALWASCVVFAVSAPVRWIDQLLRSEGAAATAVAYDRELTHVERILIGIATVGWMFGMGALFVVLAGTTLTTRQQTTAIVAALLAALVFAATTVVRRRTRVAG